MNKNVKIVPTEKVIETLTKTIYKFEKNNFWSIFKSYSKDS